jgi:hypothetical protein
VDVCYVIGWPAVPDVETTNVDANRNAIPTSGAFHFVQGPKMKANAEYLNTRDASAGLAVA